MKQADRFKTWYLWSILKKSLNFQGTLDFHLVTVLQGALTEFKVLFQNTALKTGKGFLFKSGSQCCMKRQCKQQVAGVI